VIKDNKKYFRAINPNKLLEIETQKLEELNKIIPRLNELISRPKEQTNVELYSGKSVIRVIQRNILEVLSKTKEKRENLVIGVDEKRFMEIDPIIMEQFFNQMKKNKFKEKVLVREGDTFLPAKKTTTEYKFLPKKHFEPTSTFIYGNKIAIVIFTEPLYGLIIENKILANTYRKQFNLLWKIAKQNP
jgi:hypothetical protein